MGKRKKDTVYLSQLEAIQILWPGDVRALAEFSLRCHDAQDRIFNAGPQGSLRRSRSTLHGVAGYFARIAEIPEAQIEERFKEHGLWPGATVEFDPTPPSGP